MTHFQELSTARSAYTVHFKISAANHNKKPIPLLVAAKKLNSINIKFTEIIRYSFGRLFSFQNKILIQH